jgi:hypothetical protein
VEIGLLQLDFYIQAANPASQLITAFAAKSSAGNNAGATFRAEIDLRVCLICGG